MAEKAFSSIAFAPAITPTLKDMEDIPGIIQAHTEVLEKYGAIRIDPPENWQSPILRIKEDSTFAVRVQKMPWMLVTKLQKKKAEITEFEESSSKISLREYREGALRRDAQLEPSKEKKSSSATETTAPDESILELNFWKLLQNGQKGKTVELIYGIDIENNETLNGGGMLPVTNDENKEERVQVDSVNDASGDTANGKKKAKTAEEETAEPESRKRMPFIEEEVLEFGNGNDVCADNDENGINVNKAEPTAEGKLTTLAEDEKAGNDEVALEPEKQEAHCDAESANKTAICLLHGATGVSECRKEDPAKVEPIEKFAPEPAYIASTEKVEPGFAKLENGTDDAPDSPIKEDVADSETPSKDCFPEDVSLEGGLDKKENRLEELNHLREIDTQGTEVGKSGSENKLKSNGMHEESDYKKRAVETTPDTENQIPQPPKKRKRTMLHPLLEQAKLGSNSSERSNLHTVSSERNHSKVDPKSHIGNINEQGILRHLPVMPGINQPMFYIGHRYTRFCWHVEDAFLNSLAYLHGGSAAKVWYVIPPDQALEFEKYAAEIFGPSVCDGRPSAASLLRFKTAMFHPVELVERGITVHRIFQRARSFVVTAPRSYHAGFNCGFNISEAVNFGSPLWFPTGREAAEEFRLITKQLFVPHELLLYHEARALQKEVERSGVESVTANQTLVQHASVIAAELWEYIRQGETAIRKYTLRSRSKVCIWQEIEHVASTHQLGPEYGGNAGILCDMCQYTCHFYVAMCSTCTGNEKARCHQHFGRVCNKRAHKMVVVRRYDPDFLLRLLETSEKIAGKQVSSDEKLDRQRLICSPDGSTRAYRTRLRGHAQENNP